MVKSDNVTIDFDLKKINTSTTEFYKDISRNGNT